MGRFSELFRGLFDMSIEDIVNMNFGNQASVPWITRMNAEEGQEIFALPDSMRWLHAGNNFAEDATLHKSNHAH